jgi:hypothetical protein
MRTIAWYINPERISQFIGTSEAMILAQKLKDSVGIEFSGSQNSLYRLMLKERIEDFFEKEKVKPLYQLYLNNELNVGKLFSLHQRFYCKGLAGIGSPQDIPLNYTAQVHEKLNFEDKRDWEIEISYSPRNLVSHSAFERLSGSSSLVVYGYITKIEGNKIFASPLILGDPDTQSRGVYIDNQIIYNYGELHPYSISSFAEVNNFIKDGNEIKNISMMKNISEENIKKSFSRILGRDIVPIDWGGEKSDLFSSNIIVSKNYVTAAFMFKGPAKFHEMKPRDLGKNGDQIDRLFSEPSQVCILQHCHTVGTAVRSQMKSYANRFYDRRLFSIIDGYQTLNILAAYNEL